MLRARAEAEEAVQQAQVKIEAANRAAEQQGATMEARKETTYKSPPEDVKKVVQGVLILMGHGKWRGAEHELKDWEACKPHLNRKLIDDMQAFDIVLVSPCSLVAIPESPSLLSCRSKTFSSIEPATTIR